MIVFVNYRMYNFVYNNWGCTLIYWPLSHSFRTLFCFSISTLNIYICIHLQVDGDGLMVQCEVCLSWQHGHCTGLYLEEQVKCLSWLYLCVCKPKDLANR